MTTASTGSPDGPSRNRTAVTSATAIAPADRRQRLVVASAAEFPVGSRTILKVGGREIGVFHTRAGLFALRNSCPHQAAPLCLGTVTGTTLPSKPGEYLWGMEGRVLRCPWHGWEFDLETGVGLYDPYRHERVATYPVTIEGPDVVLYA
jgi:3-phenylpropionate/trans-cinnamate dioxygenase ferredoxin subunit